MVLSVATLVTGLLTGLGWGLAVIALGFWLRVLFGPRISPFGILSVKVLTPILGKKRLVAGPPKRFAQGIGAAMSTAAAILFAAGLAPGAWILLAVLIVAASLESFAGFCLGCTIFGFLQRRGFIPDGHLRGLQQHFAAPRLTPASWGPVLRRRSQAPAVPPCPG